MRFERVEPVRAENHNATSRRKDTTSFAQGLDIVIDMLEDLVKEDDVEGVVGERHTLTDREAEVRHFEGAFGDALCIDVGAINVVREVAEASDESAHAAANVVDALALKGDLLADHCEATLKAARPHLARMAERGALVFGLDWSAGRHGGH
jgi:hypothetical protein